MRRIIMEPGSTIKLTAPCDVVIETPEQELALPSSQLVLTLQELQNICNDVRIEAIKSVRLRTGLGLRESKDIVDNWREIIKNNRIHL